MAKNNNHNTVFYVTGQGIILGDPINAEFSQWLKGELAQRFAGQPVRFVLQSHHHFDHASGAEVWNDTAEIVAHQNFGVELKKSASALPGILRRADRNSDGRIEEGELQGGPLAGFFAFADRNRDGVVNAAEMYIDVRQPESTFTDRRRIQLGGRTVEMVYVGPNHSMDAAVLYFPAERAVFAVDYITLKNRFPGGFDDAAPLADWIRAIRVVEGLDFDTAVPGHGDVGTKADVAAYRQYFEDLTKLVSDGVRANQTVEQLQASAGLDTYKDWVNFPQAKNQNIADAYALMRAGSR
jgi:glyoxylase-like metal-dependent hydrolase (beta-lactamase superfamily II)